MFNAYSVRPIGSDVFFEHLKDIQTSRHYETEPPKDNDISVHGSFPWGKRNLKHMDGYEELCLAVIAYAFIEYLQCYEKKLERDELYGQDKYYWIWNSRCISLENYFFRQSEFLERCFDDLLENVCWEGIAEIDKCIKRFHSFLRWTRPAKKYKKEDKLHENHKNE